MFEKFTEKAIKAIMLAQEEGRRLGHNFVGTEQILLGLIGEGTGVAAKVLKSMGVKLKGARLEVEKIIGRGSGDVEAEIPFTPRAKRVLELSLEEAQQLEHSYVGTEHLLLGLIREGEGVAVRVLENLGVDLSKVPTLINEMLLETVEVEVDISQKSEKTFERFTEKAIKAIMLAQEEARRLGHNCVGPEKILLGLIGEGTGVAAKVLKSMGVNLKDTRLEVEQIIGRGSGDVEAEIPFTPRAERVLEFSLEEAQQLGHNYIGTEHLLLGLIREGSGLEEGVLGNLESKAVRVLENLEVDLSKVPTLINEMLLKTVEVEVDISQKSEKTFERFTEKAIKAIMLAQEETRRLKHNFVGTEQILLGLIGEGTGVAAKVLKSMGVKLKDARLEVEQIIGRGSGFTPAEIPFTPRVKRVLEFSLEEARQLGHNYIGTEHLLLGLIRDRRKEAVAARVLENLGVDISKVRTQVIQMLGEIAEVEENISQDDSNTPQDDSNTPQDNNTNTLLFDDIEKLKAFIKDNIKEELKTISENNKINNYSQHIAKKFNENQPQFSFDDIGGAAQAKEELKTIIEFIRNPEYFQSLGARMPKGIILEGLPGTGKTLLAKAVASESNAHFFYMSASEFVELYVGVGASRVRDLFNEAKKNQPAIIYIDELDAVGQHRNSSSGANEERNNTLNQLLTELDGFESCQRIFVMASTNRGDMLDAALVRPGRFDKRIVVDLPSFAERCQILEIHLQNKKIAEDVNIEDIARYTIDFSGAELANIVNQAAILAAKNKCDSINQHLLEETTKAQGAIVPSAINVQQLKQDISKEIVGQNAALTAIAWSVCSHYANIFSRSESGVSYGNKPNLFLYGPPGSGKTAIIKATAKTLEVPFVEMTASGLVKEQAYVQKILNRLLREANDDIRRAECGMVCLYGMEEITFDDFKFVQEELARVIEGEKFDAVGESFTKKNRLIDTQNILFVCELTLDGKSRSKNSVSRQKYEGTGQNATDDEILGDLGLVRRLINQFPMIVSTEVLKQEELLEVLTRGDDSPVSLFERCCQDLGIQVELEQSALDVVTRECFQQGGDARLLKRLLNKFLREDQGDWVSQKTVTVNGLMAEKALNQRIALKKNLNSNDGQKNIVTVSEEVEKNMVTISEEVEKKVSEQEFAIAAYEQALLERTQTDFPIEWAAIQNDLGNAYWQRIRGDKAENIEMAIAAFEQALLVYTQTDFPMEWAKTQNNLGATYSDRIRGDKAQNLEAAIAACQQALLVQTQTDFPMDWAMTQNNLGIAYNNRIRGDKAENIEMAIAAYEQALLVYTQTDFPMEWATTQNNLGAAYSDRIRGDKAQNLKAAIVAYEQALLVHTQADFPTDWARTQNNLDGAYIMLGEIAEVEEDISQKSEKIFERFTETAIKVILLAQEEARRLGHNFVGTEQILLGLIGEGTGVAAQVLKFMGVKLKDARLEVEKIIGRGSGDAGAEIPFTDRAKRVLKLSLEEARQLEHSYVGTEHLLLGLIGEGEGVAARVLENLGVDISKVRTQVIQMLGEIAEVEEDISQDDSNTLSEEVEKKVSEREALFQQLEALCQQDLQVYTQTDFPIEWAMTQTGLGTAYFSRRRGDKAQNLEAAIAAYEQALLVYTQTDFPTEWAETQYVLGFAYSNRIRGDKAENLEAAIAAYEQALQVYTQTDFPTEWATTQNGLGAAYSYRIRGDKAQNVESAIAACQQALQVRTQTDFPMDWAMTQHNLGLAYSYRIRGDKAQNLESAIAAYQQALQVRTQTDFPMDWAMTQHNLGLAYSDRIRGDKAQNLEAALAAYEQALQVHTQTDFPMDWAMTQNNLGIAYIYRIRGDKAQNIEMAIAAFQQALQVRTQTDFPMDWAQTQNNLGVAYSYRIRGDKAQNVEAALAAYEQALQLHTQTDFPFEWATTKNNLGIAYSDRIRGDKAQNLEAAIAAYQQALLVQTQTDFPFEWARTQDNLGLAYSDRIRGDKAQNIEAAISCYEAALTVRKPKNLPASCLVTARNLANLAAQQQNYELAIKNYELAIAAIEQSRDWTPDEMARQEILRNNIYVYQNMVQACVNTQQYDKALETVERFRCRRLLDLILTKDFYKNREVPEDIRNLEAQMEDKQREIDYLRQQLINQKNNQEKTGATRHISRDEWDDITEEIENLMTKKQEIWQQLRELDPVLSEGIQAPTVSVEKMKELLEIPQQPGEPFHVTASNSPSPQQKGEKQTNDVALLSFYTTDHETYIFILTQTGVKLHRCQEQGYKNFQLWLRDNWLKPYSERNYLAAKHAAANLAKCDIDAIESIHSKASKVLVQLTDGTTTEIELAQFETTRKQQKHKLYKQWQNQMEDTLKELADRLQINQLIEKLTDIKEIILVPFMYLHQIPLPILPLDNGQYLGEKFRVRIAPSTQVLTFCQKQPPNREKNLPPYGIVENTKDDLPYTPTECQLVAQIYGVAPQHHLKGSKEATKAKYKKLLTREKVLGLLSSHHATSNLTQPLESKLLLGDTDLTLGELLNATIRFPQVGDLFLSCCETALGNSELTDDIFTLSAAFLSAGASNVISSLWAVNDLATTILSYFFHRNRAAGIPSVDALWQGQMELKELTLAKAEENLDNAEAVLEEVVEGSVEYEEKEKIVDNCQEIYDLVGQAQEAIGGEKPFDHPYYWAGFVCQG